MIWIWIVAAVLLSWLLCKKKVKWQHYIWLLLPIEMYGISIAGATIKPYMIYGMAIMAYSIIKKREVKVPGAIVLIGFLLLLSDVVNGLITASIMQHLMFVFVVAIACSYLYSQDGIIDFDEISTVTIAATIGYGIVFSLAYMSASFNIGLPDVYAADRYSTGMVVRSVLTGAGRIVTLRLRGFCIDPNGVVTTLIPGAAFGLANILYREGDKVKSCLAVGFFFFVVICSGSRMALASSFIMAVIMFIIGYKQTDHKKQWILTGIVFSFALVISLLVNQNHIIQEILYSVDYFFSSRASLTDEAGRLTIWESNFKYLVENNRLLVGVGQNQIQYLATSRKECHNTWLEWICGTGLFIGLFMDFFFMLAPVPFSRRAKRSKLLHQQDVLPIILAYIIVLISITTVDYITNSVMLFLAVLFRYGIPFKNIAKSVGGITDGQITNE